MSADCRTTTSMSLMILLSSHFHVTSAHFRSALNSVVEVLGNFLAHNSGCSMHQSSVWCHTIYTKLKAAVSTFVFTLVQSEDDHADKAVVEVACRKRRGFIQF